MISSPRVPMKVPNNNQASLPCQFVLSILAPSYLISQNWGSNVAQSVVELGRWSEEILRGDRLPTLPFPEVATTTEQTNETAESQGQARKMGVSIDHESIEKTVNPFIPHLGEGAEDGRDLR